MSSTPQGLRVGVERQEGGAEVRGAGEAKRCPRRRLGEGPECICLLSFPFLLIYSIPPQLLPPSARHCTAHTIALLCLSSPSGQGYQSEGRLNEDAESWWVWLEGRAGDWDQQLVRVWLFMAAGHVVCAHCCVAITGPTEARAGTEPTKCQAQLCD